MATWFIRASDIRLCDDPMAFIATRVFDEQGEEHLPFLVLCAKDTLRFLDAFPVVGQTPMQSVTIDNLVEQERGYVKIIPVRLPPLSL